MKMTLKGEDVTVEIEVVGRSHPDCLDYWVGNWVISYIQVKIPGFDADFLADLRTAELQRFLEELKSMRDNLQGAAKLIHMEKAIQLEGVIRDGVVESQVMSSSW